MMHRTDLICRAEHPSARELPGRFGGRIHGATLLSVPWACRPTGRILLRQDLVTPGMIGVHCFKCAKITEYEIVPAAEDAA